MTVLYWVLAIVSLSILGLGTYWTIVNYRRYKTNILVAHELDQLIYNALEVVQAGKEIAAKQELNIHHSAHTMDGAALDLGSPAVLSTLVTVLVKKHGDVRLSLRDFTIPDEEYVSVYVDTNTKELILSLNHRLGEDQLYSMMALSNSDDNTFH